MRMPTLSKAEGTAPKDPRCNAETLFFGADATWALCVAGILRVVPPAFVLKGFGEAMLGFGEAIFNTAALIVGACFRSSETMSLGNRQGAQCVQPGQGWCLESLRYFPGCMEGHVGRGPQSESWQASVIHATTS